MDQMNLRVPAEYVEGSYASGLSIQLRGEEVSLLFWRDREMQDDPADDATAEVVAHVIYDRARFNNLPAVLANIRDRLTAEGPDNPGT